MAGRISTIIATLGRVEELGNTLRTLCGCTTLPDEVIVVDGDAGESARSVVEEYAGEYEATAFTYAAVEPGLPGQRNAGLELATGDTIFFLDDDVELEPSFISEILSVYDDPEVGGATGLIANQVKPAWLLRVLQRFFLLSRFAGRCYLQKSGLPMFLYKPDKTIDVGILNGCNMSFRRSALGEFRFDDRINYFDDDDVSLTVGKEWRLVQVPDARVKHLVSTKGRPRAPAAADRSIIEQRLLHRKHLPQTPASVVAYYWSVLGAAFIAFVRLHPWVSLRTLLGLWAALAGTDRRL
ncbi:MAG: glycosyltransferase family 2 protein [Candidatus Coatesbacteria bacterium]|nr:MAG: glycosyltransferase family 2 protein [Candidatus Coatesbacteria bacterium]